MHEIDQVLIPPTPQPQGTICVQKDHPDSSFHCPIMDMAMGMEVRDGAALTEDEEEQQEEEEETPYDESPEERRERRQWGPGGYGYETLSHRLFIAIREAPDGYCHLPLPIATCPSLLPPAPPVTPVTPVTGSPRRRHQCLLSSRQHAASADLC